MLFAVFAVLGRLHFGWGQFSAVCARLRGRPRTLRRTDVERGIERIVVFRVQIVLHDTQRIAEAVIQTRKHKEKAAANGCFRCGFFTRVKFSM